MPLAAQPVNRHRDDLARLQQLLAPLPTKGAAGSGAEPDLLLAAGPQEAVGTVARQELEAALLELRRPLGEELGWEQSLDQVVDPAVSLAPGDPEDPGLGERLEDRPDLVRRAPVPVDRGAGREVGRGEMAVGPDPLEELLDERGVLVEDAAVVRGAVEVPGDPEPGQVGRGDEAQALVVGLVENPLVVEEIVGQLAAVARDAGEEDEVVVSTGDLEGVELDRAEPLENGQDPVATGRQGPRRGEVVAQGEEPARGRGRDRQGRGHRPMVGDGPRRA